MVYNEGFRNVVCKQPVVRELHLGTLRHGLERLIFDTDDRNWEPLIYNSI